MTKKIATETVFSTFLKTIEASNQQCSHRKIDFTMLLSLILFCIFLSIVSSAVIRLTDVTKTEHDIKTKVKSLGVLVEEPLTTINLPANIPRPIVGDEIVFQGELINREFIGVVEKATCPKPHFCICSGLVGSEGAFSMTRSEDVV